eukprot:CAMPEP_0169094854 /NCGR_PEP_ID=MMETSP1015-20121227/18166_1 /TAXON_ID=342587 /ORGANISM="Karlodinium micrum, Strain CCMP2283" /LENGTH=352 /DNA_ID=CAMNT_0009155537 /DNA_START=51 /DNA_END=1109 /DNA_ORIENTATION=-
MALVMLPANALSRRRNRCVTLKDFRFTDGVGTPTTCTPVMLTPTSALGGTTPLSQMSGAMRRQPRCHTMAFAAASAMFGADPFGFNDDTLSCDVSHSCDTRPVNRDTRRSKTLGAELAKHVSVSVVAPGGGTGMNSSVYSALARKEGVSVNILGQSRAPYDRYPSSWASEGAPPPNLETFALDLSAQGCLDNLDCLVVGSRGGQVVLPTLWEHCGEAVPPAVVMNGGCAMGLPTPVSWPESAVTFLLLGGNDYFKGALSVNEYLSDSQRRVPKANSTTAILLVSEMTHMPQAHLLTGILHNMILAVTSWKDSGRVPLNEFSAILTTLRRGGWSGILSFKTLPGDAWESEVFP